MEFEKKFECQRKSHLTPITSILSRAGFISGIKFNISIKIWKKILINSKKISKFFFCWQSGKRWKQRTNSGNMVITNQEEEGEGRRARAKKAEIIISVKTVLEARAKNGRFWAGRQPGWGWRFMKRWKFEKSSFFIRGTKGLRARGPQCALRSDCHNPDSQD